MESVMVLRFPLHVNSFFFTKKLSSVVLTTYVHCKCLYPWLDQGITIFTMHETRPGRTPPGVFGPGVRPYRAGGTGPPAEAGEGGAPHPPPSHLHQVRAWGGGAPEEGSVVPPFNSDR